MEKQTEIKPTGYSFNQPAYVIFLFAGIYFLIKKYFSQAVIFWGLALVFDPFKTTISFNKRPVSQQIWLVVHLCFTLVLFVVMIFGK